MKTAQQWFSPGEDSQEAKTTENIESAASDLSTPSTTISTTPTTTTPTALKRIDYSDDDEDYYYDDANEDKPYRVDIFDAGQPMAVRLLGLCLTLAQPLLDL
jgi:hypothetical protein